MVGAFEFGGEIIGTIRVVPMGQGLALTDELIGCLPPDSHLVPAGSWEVGRLVLDPQWRSEPEALGRCLWLAVDYLTRHADADRLYACCTHVLSRLYRRFGFAAFAQGVRLPGTEKDYTLIQGEAADVLAALERVAQAARLSSSKEMLQ
jgi:N-acyl-L-homoserine lactone synthetase